ncbi:hypothetical protein JYQ62_25020 [Nostoc sp. UHCC 0702]|nr:hypothetical protein JYQ62_25020 [Nostoc sp. UHCC 0702]
MSYPLDSLNGSEHQFAPHTIPPPLAIEQQEAFFSWILHEDDVMQFLYRMEELRKVAIDIK